MGIEQGPPVAASRIAAALFPPVQQRVLGLLFGQPDRQFAGNELIRIAASGTGAVHRFLTRLVEADLVVVHPVGRMKFYQANPASPVFDDLVGLIRKTVGIVAPLQQALAPFGARITAAFVYGSIAKGGERAGSDVDLMVISDDVDYGDLYGGLAVAEAALARKVNPTLMSRDEWRRKRAEDGFASRVASQSKLFVIGTDDGLF